jgi:acyl carrier protein
MSDTKSRLIEVIGRYVTDPGELEAVGRGEPFLTATSLDSLTMMTVIIEIEKRFSMRFDLETIEHTFETLETVVTYLDRRGAQ